MSKVVGFMSMSLDGFVADADDGVEDVFAWYFSGDVEVTTPRGDFSFRVSPASAEYLRALIDETGAMLTGRRTFEKAHGWNGNHGFGVPAFVVTHEVPDGWPRPDSTVHFVTDGMESAVGRAKDAAGDKIVAVHGGDTISQLLSLGLCDELQIDLAAVLLGSGVPLFQHIGRAPVRLAGRRVVAGVGVTHLRYAVEPA